MSEGDIQIPASSMGQAVTVLADIAVSYINGMQPRDWSGTDRELKVYHQVAIALLMRSILTRSNNPEDMAKICDIIAAELREQLSDTQRSEES
jgi:hypothetical protein